MASPRGATTSRRALVGLAMAVLGATTFGTAAGAADDPISRTVHKLLYAVDKPVCAEPASETLMRCFAYKRVDVAKGTRSAYAYRANVAAGPSGGFTPSTLAKAYGYNPKARRSTTTVGVVLWHDAPTVLSDLNHFDAKYHLKKETSTSFRKVNQRGRSTPLPARDADTAGEIALDTQAVRGVCNTCRILLVEADAPTAKSLAAAVDTAVRLGASIVTNSYGTPESRMPASVLRAYTHPGVVMTVSTGDSGWFGWDYDNEQAKSGDGAVSFPSDLPSVVSVGGTTLHVNSGGVRTSETVWNNNGPHDSIGSSRQRSMGASGGGCSKLYAATTWQLHYPGYAAANCHGKRLAADVALDADPQTGYDVYDSYGSGGWVTIGGTSLSAPLAAGMYALAGGSRGAAYPSSALYANASVHTGRRYDVTVGGTGFCQADATATCSAAVYKPGLLNIPPGTHNPNSLGLGLVDCSYPRSGNVTGPARSRECNATPGYDGASGVGTPRSTSLFSRTDPTVGVGHPKTVKHKHAAAFTARVKETVGRTYFRSARWSWGDKRTTSTRSRSVKHTYAKKGRYPVTLTVVDSRFQVVVRHSVITVR